MDEFSKERDQLREVQAVFEKAVENNTIEDLRPYTDPQFSYVSFTDRAFSDFDTFCKQWKITRQDMLGSGSFKTQLDPEPSLFMGDIAVCHGNSKNCLINDKGKKFNFSSHWTVIFRRSAGSWKVLRAHNSLNPFSNPMLVHGVKQKLANFSIITFILGGLLCSLLTFLLLA